MQCSATTARSGSATSCCARAGGQSIAAGDAGFVGTSSLPPSGAELMRQRRAYVARLSRAAGETHRDIAGGREVLSVAYRPNVDADGDDARACMEALFAAREGDVRRMTTSVGPPSRRCGAAGRRARRAGVRLAGPAAHRSAVDAAGGVGRDARGTGGVARADARRRDERIGPRQALPPAGAARGHPDAGDLHRSRRPRGRAGPARSIACLAPRFIRCKANGCLPVRRGAPARKPEWKRVVRFRRASRLPRSRLFRIDHLRRAPPPLAFARRRRFASAPERW